LSASLALVASLPWLEGEIGNAFGAWALGSGRTDAFGISLGAATEQQRNYLPRLSVPEHSSPNVTLNSHHLTESFRFLIAFASQLF
jgi:hypothetical protein